MFDGDSGQYNLPYVKKVLVSDSYLLMNLVYEKQGCMYKKETHYILPHGRI